MDAVGETQSTDSTLVYCDMDAVGETQSTGSTLVDSDMDAVGETQSAGRSSTALRRRRGDVARPTRRLHHIVTITALLSGITTSSATAEIARVGGRYEVHGHSKSLTLIHTESPNATFY